VSERFLGCVAKYEIAAGIGTRSIIAVTIGLAIRARRANVIQDFLVRAAECDVTISVDTQSVVRNWVGHASWTELTRVIDHHLI
jgi:hypothetical protein